jgi:hypothetical protein
VQAQKDLEDSFQRWVHNYNEAQERKQNYSMASEFYKQHLKKISNKQSDPWTPPVACSNGVAPP